MSAFSRHELLRAATTSPWTKDFRHLQNFPRHWLKRTNLRGEPVIKSVRPSDRIKYWNIVPGDQIRILGTKDKLLREVLSINRISNRVFVRGTPTGGEEVKQGKVPQSKNFHYSRCQLFVGNYEFPPQKGATESRIIPVFSQRIGTSKPYWNKRCHRYEWERFATKTVPTIPYLKGQRIAIPWPKPDKPILPEPGLYDTLQEDVAKVTYKTPSLTPSLSGLLPRPPSETDFLKSLFNPHLRTDTFDTTPLEIYLSKELSNPHSRAKKQARWQAYQLYTKSLLRDYIAAELKNLNGRTEREARAQAAWRWRTRLAEEKVELKKRRWKHRDVAARLEKKQARKVRKEIKLKQRLTDLTLMDEPNQVIPKDL